MCTHCHQRFCNKQENNFSDGYAEKCKMFKSFPVSVYCKKIHPHKTELCPRKLPWFYACLIYYYFPLFSIIFRHSLLLYFIYLGFGFDWFLGAKCLMIFYFGNHRFNTPYWEEQIILTLNWLCTIIIRSLSPYSLGLLPLGLQEMFHQILNEERHPDKMAASKKFRHPVLAGNVCWAENNLRFLFWCK